MLNEKMNDKIMERMSQVEAKYNCETTLTFQNKKTSYP